jgi:hypothetical protein
MADILVSSHCRSSTGANYVGCNLVRGKIFSEVSLILSRPYALNEQNIIKKQKNAALFYAAFFAFLSYQVLSTGGSK